MSDTAVAPSRPRREQVDPLWWRQAAVYQIYPRSFADGNGDGIGDFAGIIGRVPHLAALGVDAVWLSPFYPSDLADGGYDVADYRDVDPRIGTLAEFDDLVAALHGEGIRLIVDIVPNHSSDRHPWFTEALASAPGSPARDRYIFRDGTGPDGTEPPSDWQSIFGGPAWTRVPDGQWYLHLFAKEQPDLNWANDEVRADFLTTLRFWSDRGVDGFRVDVAHALAKDLSEPLPSTADLARRMQAAAGGVVDPAAPRHPFWDRDEVHEIYAEWRRVFDSYDPPRMAVAEAWVAPDRLARYATADGLGQAFNFDLLLANFDAATFRTIIADSLALAAESGATSTWVLSNHDVVRHATRYGLPHDPTVAGRAPKPVDFELGNDGRTWLLEGGDPAAVDASLGLQRATAATLLIMALPGSVYLYQGEELGLHEVGQIPGDTRQDPSYFRNPGVEIGRDGCRVPLPWTPDGPSYGFGDGAAHLPQPIWFAEAAASRQDAAPDSVLNLYRHALALRQELQGAEELTWHDSPANTLHFSRPGGWHVVTNFGSTEVPLPRGEVIISSRPCGNGALPAGTTAWLRVVE